MQINNKREKVPFKTKGNKYHIMKTIKQELG